MQIAQKVAQRQQNRGVFPGQTGNLLLPELGRHQRAGGLHPGAAHLPVAGELALRERCKRRVFGGRFVHNNLRRRKTGHLVEHMHGGVFPRKGGGVGLAGGDVAGGEAGHIPLQPHSGAEIAPPGLQRGLPQHRAGGHHPDDVPLHKALGRGGILRLLADGYLVALGDKPGDVSVGGVVGDAAHGYLVLKRLIFILVPGGEGEIQLPGGSSGVGTEHLIKIAQPEKQNGVLVLFLDLQILFHHGGQFSHKQSHLSAACAANLTHAGGKIMKRGMDPFRKSAALRPLEHLLDLVTGELHRHGAAVGAVLDPAGLHLLH